MTTPLSLSHSGTQPAERHVAGVPHVAGHRPRRRVRRVAAIAVSALVAVVGTLLAVGFAFETVASARDQHAFAPPGAMVDVGGHALHLSCIGQGSPAVILETGLGSTSSAWALVQPAVATSTRTCAYDRAGLGWSQPGPEPRDARQISAELHSLLQTAGVAGPYVLVGHSNGGLYSRMYAGMYPNDVAGMVLVDATPSDLFTYLPATRADQVGLGQQATSAEWLARFGLARLLIAPRARAELDGFPSAEREAFVANYATAGYWRTFGAEARGLEASMTQVEQAGGLGDRPLIVLSTPEGAPSADAARTKQALEDEMAALSTDSRQQVVEGASHMGLATHREHASITSLAIRTVVDAVRSGNPVSIQARP
jgi:pimeloyl-ACP methyl ester carboxylesterase